MTITKSFSIKPAGFTKASVTLSASSFTWNGAEKKPRVTVKIGNRQLTAGRDYTVSYKNNVSVGTASVTITAKGNYTGSISKNFSITAADFTKTSVSLSVSSFTYDGAEKKPKITVKNGKKQLTANTDYTVSYKNNINAGTASVTITGKGSYSGSQTKNFTITPADLTKTKISLSASSFIYDGAEKKPAITIKAGKKQLTLNKDYTISYKNNTNVGTASVTVTGKGNYTGTISKSFTIAATNLSTADVKLSAASFTYNGKAFTPSVTVTCNGKVLTNVTDYSVAYTNNINAGTSRVTITGIGAYSGVKTVTFRIKRAKATLTPTAAALTLTQSSRKTAVIKRKKTDGKISLKSSNSKIVKISGTSIIPLSPGKATVTITAAQGRHCFCENQHLCTPASCQQSFSEVLSKRSGNCILEAGKIHYLLSDPVQHCKQHEECQNDYSKRHLKICSSEKADQRQKILCSNPYSENSEQKELLLYLEQNNFRKSKIIKHPNI